MFGLSTIKAAFLRLAGSLNALADTCDEINSGVRQRLLLDSPEEPREVIDHHPADEEQEDAPQRNGRKRAAAK